MKMDIEVNVIQGQVLYFFWFFIGVCEGNSSFGKLCGVARRLFIWERVREEILKSVVFLDTV